MGHAVCAADVASGENLTIRKICDKMGESARSDTQAAEEDGLLNR